MSDNVASCLTCKDDDETTKDLMTFCMQLVHHSQWKSARVFRCGSSGEIPYYNLIVKYVNIGNDNLDVDSMIHINSSCVVNRSASLPKSYTGDIIRIYTDDVHAGYAKLMREKGNTEMQYIGFHPTKNYEAMHGPAVMTDTKKLTLRCNYFLSNADTDKLESEKVYIASHDTVCALHSPCWPAEATEWITRNRSHGFPSKSVIKQAVRYGCDFVHISHSRLPIDNDWRFSFSKAELFIARSWTVSQRIVYSTLWVLNKRIASSNLCTYYFKTLMFWACEELTTAFWHENLLIHSVRELLTVLLQWIKSKSCASYFIPRNNMMDHLIDTDLSYEIDALGGTIQSHQLIHEVIDKCRRLEMVSANTIYHIECPAWIKRAFIINWRIHNEYDNYTDLFRADLTMNMQAALYIEVSDIYRGLCCQQKSVNCVKAPEKYFYCLQAERHLLNVVNLRESLKIDVIYNCSRELLVSMMGKFIARDTDACSDAGKNVKVQLHTSSRPTADRPNFVNDRNEQKDLLYSRSVEKRNNKLVQNDWGESISKERDINIAVHRITNTNMLIETDVEFFKEWPGRSPTVNASWFIAKAYLANLYYTSQRDVSLTMKTCDDIINVYRLSHMNQMLAERHFPFVLSTQWTVIYDENIQELLGFYSLSSYLFYPSIRAVYLGVCPVWFAFYLELRILTDQCISHGLCDSIIHEFFSKHCSEHINVCGCDKQVNNGLLTTIISFIILTHDKEEK